MTLDPSQEQRLGASSSVVMVRLGGQDYPLETDPRCSVCNSRWRQQVEQALIAGRTFSRVVKSLPEGSGITNAAVQRHSELHLIEANAHLRKRLEARAEQRGMSIEHGEQMLVNELTLAEAVVQKTWEALANGDLQPKLIDGLRAAKLLADYDVADEASDSDMAEAFMYYMAEAQGVMSEEQFASFRSRLTTNSGLRKLMDRVEQGSAELD